jgi:hypothetical protein
MIDTILRSLVDQLSDRRLQRTWKGKHTLVRALASVSVCHPDAIDSLVFNLSSTDALVGVSLGELVDVFSRECERQTGTLSAAGEALDVIKDESALAYKRIACMSAATIFEGISSHLADSTASKGDFRVSSVHLCRLLDALLPLIPKRVDAGGAEGALALGERPTAKEEKELGILKALVLQIRQHAVRAVSFSAKFWALAFRLNAFDSIDEESRVVVAHVLGAVHDPLLLQQQSVWSLRQALLEGVECFWHHGVVLAFVPLLDSSGPKPFVSFFEDVLRCVLYGLIEAKYQEVRRAAVDACAAVLRFGDEHIAEADFHEALAGQREGLLSGLSAAVSADPSLGSRVALSRAFLAESGEAPLKRAKTEA